MIDLKTYLELPSETIEEIIKHAESEFPRESCGYIVDNKYVACINSSEEQEDSFVIEEISFYKYYLDKKIQWIVHSHNNNQCASKIDMKKQRSMEVPFIIVNIKYGKLSDLFFFGSNIKLPYIGRPFYFGCTDCLTLVKDYYKDKFNMALPNPPRSINFNEVGDKLFESYLEEQLKKFDLIKKEDIEEDDILFYQWNNQIGHVGIYINKNKVLHHFVNQLSGYYPLEYKYKNLFFAFRRK